MDPVPEKWRVTFAPAPQPGSVPCARIAVPPDLEVWQDNNGSICAYGYVADGYGWMDLVGTGKFRFDRQNREVTAFALPDVSPDLVRDAYSHAALPMALHFFGCEVLHASAVRTIRGIVAFCAFSETGKSTIASAFALRGYSLWADDAVAIDGSDTDHGGVALETLCLPFSLRLRHASAQYLGERDDYAGRVELDREFSSASAIRNANARCFGCICELQHIPLSSRLPLRPALSVYLESWMRSKTLFLPYAAISSGSLSVSERDESLRIRLYPCPCALAM